MKPLLLQMQAFGPFGRRQAIDFSQLGTKTFFLIHGATGSGKTSILDAMCFALFGDSSGEERKASDLRSQHADPATLTEVTFDFSLGERRYRVRRLPEQMRPARRGGGMTRQAPEAELLAVPDGGDACAAEPLASGWEKVTRKVVELLGFESRQFRQVIVLPQGKFFEFLKANSQERERILQVLFGTELYRRIEEALKRAADDLQRQARDCDTQRRALLEQAAAETVQALEDRRGEQAQALQAAVAAREVAGRDEEIARQALQQLLEVASRFTEHDAAQLAVAGLAQQSPTWEGKRAELAAARKAQAIVPYEETAVEARRASQEAAARSAVAAQALAAAQAALSGAESELRKQEASAADIDRLAARIAEWQALHAAVDALEAARTELAQATAQEQRAGKALRLAEEAAHTAAAALDKLQAEEQAHATAAAPLQACVLQEQQLAERLTVAQRLVTLRNDLQGSEHLVQARTQTFERAQVAARDAAAAREDTFRRWLAGQAARIAHALHDGQACPVCGSAEHPAPASAQGGIVSDEELQAAERASEQAASQLAAAQAALGEAGQAQAGHQAALQALASGAGDVAADDVAAQLAAARSGLRAAQAAARSLEAVRARLPQAQTASTATGQSLLDAQAAMQLAAVKHATALARLEERQQAVPAALATRVALDTAIREATAERARLAGALESARKQLADAQAAAERARATADGAAETAASEERKAAGKSGEFDGRVHAAGFADVAAYADARRDAAAIDAIAADLTRHEQALAAARDRARRAQEAVAALPRPDVAAGEAAHRTAQQAKVLAVDAASRAGAALAATDALLQALRAIEERYAAIEQRHRVLRDVADKANGHNGHRMSFQRYVLATLLDEVLAATTQRLRIMSRGRYEMRRRLEAADSRSAGGLDLEVFDHYTGHQRGVQTLSGGESFLASLALALGLSDVVQSYAGGIRLDAIFVDEGFGTLDPEALDFAVRTLKDLQQAGRMVGIISHVAELKTWIDARLEVKPSQAGSEATFVV